MISLADTAAAAVREEDLPLRILAARDRRQESIDRLEAPNSTVIAVSMSIPGPDKHLPGAHELFHHGLAEVTSRVQPAAAPEVINDLLGPFALYPTRLPASEAKVCAIFVEESHPAARLLDIDVYEGGLQLSRTDLRLPSRPCLLCSRGANECMRVRRHDHSDIARKAAELLRTFGP